MIESMCDNCIHKIIFKKLDYQFLYRKCKYHNSDIEFITWCDNFQLKKELNDSEKESYEDFRKKMLNCDYPRYCNLCGKKNGVNKEKGICKKCEKNLPEIVHGG